MKKPVLLVLGIVVIALFWLIFGLIGWLLVAEFGIRLLGAKTMAIVASVVVTILLGNLLGQYLAGTADYFLSVDNPRPLDDNEVTITSIGWGFFSQSGRSRTEDLTGQGFADVRFFAGRGQVLLAIVSLGLIRRVSIAWRGNAGQHPLGQA